MSSKPVERSAEDWNPPPGRRVAASDVVPDDHGPGRRHRRPITVDYLDALAAALGACERAFEIRDELVGAPAMPDDLEASATAFLAALRADSAAMKEYELTLERMIRALEQAQPKGVH